MDAPPLPGCPDLTAGTMENTTHRYVTWRTWDLERPLIAFIDGMPLDANTDAPALDLRENIAQGQGAGGFVQMYVFARKHGNPDAHPVGLQTDYHIITRCKHVPLVIACWGYLGSQRGRARVARLSELLAEHGVKLHTLGITDGWPVIPAWNLLRLTAYNPLTARQEVHHG